MRKFNVVVADDIDMYLTEMSTLIEHDDELELIGKASNGEDLCRIIEEKEPDIILMDIIMPKLDGFGVMERIFHNPGQHQPPIFIIVTSIMQEAITRDAFLHGASYYIVKPFQKETLLNRIKHYSHSDSPRNTITDRQITPTITESKRILDLESDVTNTLYQLGIPNHLRGFAYLRDAVLLSVENIEMLTSVTKILYHEVAKLHNSTNMRVERAIRHAIELAAREGNLAAMETLTGYPFHTKKTKPSNSELIAYLTDIFRLRYKNTRQ